MGDIEAGDSVVFRQVASDGYAREKKYPVLIDDGTAYLVHRGDVGAVAGEKARVNWDDAETTKTPLSRLETEEDAGWYDG